MSTAKKEIDKLGQEDGGCVNFPSMIFNYGCYHQNKVNKAIHFIGIPIIVFTLLIFLMHLTHTPGAIEFLDNVPLPQEVTLPGGVKIDKYILTPYILIYGTVTLIYLISDWVVGLAWLAWTIPIIYANAGIWKNRDDDYFGMSQLQFYGALHIAAWISQFIGHGIFEKRAPALMHNAMFAFLAPFFETFLVLNMIFGYKEGPRLERINKLIHQDIDEFRASKNPDKYSKVN